MIHGAGFQIPVDANLWDAQQVLVGTVQCDIVGHYTNANRIVCLTRPYPHDLTVIQETIALPVMVQQFGGIGGGRQTKMDNAFKYHVGETPYISWRSALGGSGGDVLSMQGRLPRWSVGKYSSDREALGCMAAQTSQCNYFSRSLLHRHFA